MADYIVKRPSDVRVEQFDFGTFVAKCIAAGTVVADITYHMRSQPGLTLSAVLSDEALGLLDVTISGGTMGVVYDYGIEAKTPQGDSEVDMRKVRVRDPSLFEILPEGGEVAVGDVRLVTDTGETLVTDTGEELVWA